MCTVRKKRIRNKCALLEKIQITLYIHAFKMNKYIVKIHEQQRSRNFYWSKFRKTSVDFIMNNQPSRNLLNEFEHVKIFVLKEHENCT